MAQALRLALCGLAVVAVASFSGCEVGGSLPYEDDGPLERRLQDFRRNASQGDSRPLTAMTDFEWDSLYIFREADSYREINAVTGTDFFPAKGYVDSPEALLVFKRGEKVVYALAPLGGDYMSGGEGPHRSGSTRVRLEVRRRGKLPGLVSISDERD